MGDSAFYGAAVDAATDILRDVYRVQILKALDPLDPKDFVAIALRIARDLRRGARPVETKAVESAIAALGVDWTGISQGQRTEVIRKAAEAIEAAGVPVSTVTSKVFDERAGEVVRQTRKSTIKANGLGIPVPISGQDERVIKLVSESQSNFVRDEYGRRAVVFSNSARNTVARGLDQGASSADIARDLQRSAKAQQVTRAKSYWENIATVFANRARTFGQLSSFGEAGIERFKFEAILDEVTSNVCRYMHNRTFSVRKGLKQINDVERLREPEKIKDVQPFVQDGVDADGNDIIYYKEGERRITVATVVESAVGRKDERGKFSGGLGSTQLENANVTMPPLHGRCRSTVVAIT